MIQISKNVSIEQIDRYDNVKTFYISLMETKTQAARVYQYDTEEFQKLMEGMQLKMSWTRSWLSQ